MFDFNPQLVEEEFGTEPSIREVLTFFYVKMGIEQPQASIYVEQYINAIYQHLKDTHAANL